MRDIRATTESPESRSSSLESRVTHILLHEDSEPFVLCAEALLKRMWNDPETASKEAKHHIKKYEKQGLQSGWLKTSWKDKLAKITSEVTKHIEHCDSQNNREEQTAGYRTQATSSFSIEMLCIREAHRGSGTHFSQEPHDDENKELVEDFELVCDNFADERGVEESRENVEEEDRRHTDPSLAPAVPAVVLANTDPPTGGEIAHLPVGKVFHKGPVARSSTTWVLKGYRALKITAMSRGWALYEADNVYVRDHIFRPGVYLKKRGCLLGLHLHIQVQSWPQGVSCLFQEGMRLRLIHPIKNEDCTLEARVEESWVLSQSVTQHATGTAYSYVSKASFSVRDIEDGKYIRNNELTFVLEVL